MAIESQYANKCKDCGLKYEKGDMIDTNGNESLNKNGEMKPHWCKEGANCKGKMQLQGTPEQNPQSPQSTITEFDAGHFTIKDDEMKKLYEIIDNEMAEMIPAYHRILANINAHGIKNPNPALVGMFFNNYIKKRLQK